MNKNKQELALGSALGVACLGFVYLFHGWNIETARVGEYWSIRGEKNGARWAIIVNEQELGIYESIYNKNNEGFTHGFELNPEPTPTHPEFGH